MLSKILNIIKSYQYNLYLALCIGLISFISYNLGRIEALDKKPIKITEKSFQGVNSSLKADIFEASSNPLSSSGKPKKELDSRVVTSKSSSSKKYHHTWCPGNKSIKEENKIWFNSAEEAEKAGYTLAGNCSI